MFYIYKINFVSSNFMQNIVLPIYVSSTASLKKTLPIQQYSSKIYSDKSHSRLTVLNASNRSDLMIYDHSYKNWGKVVYLCIFLMKELKK